MEFLCKPYLPALPLLVYEVDTIVILILQKGNRGMDQLCKLLKVLQQQVVELSFKPGQFSSGPHVWTPECHYPSIIKQVTMAMAQ